MNSNDYVISSYFQLYLLVIDNRVTHLLQRGLLCRLKPMRPVQIMHEHMMQIRHAHWLHS